MLPVPTAIYVSLQQPQLKSFQKPQPSTPKLTFSKAEAVVLADLSPLIGPDIPQGRASPRTKHSGTVWHPSSLGLLRQRSNELIHNGRSPTSLVAVMAAADQHIAI